MAKKKAAVPTEKQFSIQKLYVKDISFESPSVPGIFTEKWTPKVDINLTTKSNKGQDDGPDDLYEVSVTVTATVKTNDKTAYLVEATQVGAFSVANFPEKEMRPLLGSYCPNILFPYLREAISGLVTKGGFPPLLLNPVNFDAFYAQHLQKADKTKLN
ncbi:MAG: protein-export chaperone SecB [Cycloclasticus sp. symbiont of Poecilosclerida sp. M]|nr:MAG: protein-export chaperone SecB [Cycloclasticus sp. symbiont of Poecilosclerida sp. M]